MKLAWLPRVLGAGSFVWVGTLAIVVVPAGEDCQGMVVSWDVKGERNLLKGKAVEDFLGWGATWWRIREGSRVCGF